MALNNADVYVASVVAWESFDGLNGVVVGGSVVAWEAHDGVNAAITGAEVIAWFSEPPKRKFSEMQPNYILTATWTQDATTKVLTVSIPSVLLPAWVTLTSYDGQAILVRESGSNATQVQIRLELQIAGNTVVLESEDVDLTADDAGVTEISSEAAGFLIEAGDVVNFDVEVLAGTTGDVFTLWVPVRIETVNPLTMAVS